MRGFRRDDFDRGAVPRPPSGGRVEPMVVSDRTNRLAPGISGSPGYTEFDAERWVSEPAKHAGRTPFARDRARVLHSAALRGLAAKTQVTSPGSDDFIRTRLTHSLEVAQVGRELGQSLGCDPDVVDAACLAHDLGHPPFGHNGEEALDEAARAIGGFEGNAQTLRVLTRLEAKSFEHLDGGGGRSVGLNLTRASLDAATKYPWRRGEAPGPFAAKFGVYDDDLDVFGWLRQAAMPGRRCVEAQVMDFADDVAYSVHDVEDAVVSGRASLPALRDPGERAQVWQVARDWYLPDACDAELDDAYVRLRGFGYWPEAPYDGSRRSLAGLKDLTSQLIGRFCTAARQATYAAYGEDPVPALTRYTADVVVPRQTRLEIVVLKAVAARYVMRADEQISVHSRQREVVHELVDWLWRSAPQWLSPAFRADFDAAPGDAVQLRVIIDQVASLTDASALAWHQRVTAGSRAGGG